MQRLDLKTLRYDAFGRSVLIDGRGAVVEVPHEALETYCDRKMDREEAMREVAEQIKRLTQLAGRVPADDGKIVLTTGILQNDGVFDRKSGGQ